MPTYLLLGIVLAIGPLALSTAGEKSAGQTSALTDEMRKELLNARETAWRSFFQKDLDVVDKILVPELIAIQENSDRWDNRTSLIALAKAMTEKGVQLLRLEFPRTEIQLFGDTAILYYTYIFETGLKGKSVVDGGRGTEIFVRRDGKWVDALLRQAVRRRDELIECLLAFHSLPRRSSVVSITLKFQRTGLLSIFSRLL
jgi:hypothetical protein